MTSTKRAARIALEAVFALWFAVIVFFTLLSDGRLLNLHAAMVGHVSWAVLCVIAWVTWIAFAVMLIAGPWRRRKGVQHYTLLATLMFCVLIGVEGLLPKDTPDWLQATLIGVVACLANLTAEHLIGRRAQR